MMVYHTTLLLDLRQKLQYLANLPFARMSDVLVYVSENQRQYCTRQGMRGRRIETIHNGIESARFNPAVRAEHRAAMRAQLGFAEGDFVVGLTAAFRAEKNHAQAVEAVAALRTQGLPARLLLLGDGPTRPQIEAQVAALGLSDHVVFAGRQSDVPRYLSAIDVGILTSTAVETFSLAALEFMGMGIPGVLSQLGGASEMVRDGHNGYIFPVGDTPALVTALARLAQPGVAQTMGAAAAEFTATAFSLETMVERYQTLLGQMGR